MRAFEFIKNEASEEWAKGKLKIDIPGQDGEFYLSANDQHLILHGNDITSFAYADRDGDSYEAQFNFDYDITAQEIADLDYPDLEDQGIYLYDGQNSFDDDIKEIVDDFMRTHGEEIQRYIGKLSPEEGGLEVDDDWFESSYPFAGKKVGHKEGPAGQWRNKGSSAKRPARPGDLVGGGM